MGCGLASSCLRAAHEGASHNIANTTDAKVHARMRKYLGNSFTESALKSQQPIIEKYASLFITKLRAMAAAPTCIDHGAAVDMTDWINFFTIDVIGDLSFGEPFGCLDSSEYHPWVRALFDFLKGMVFEVSARLYPWFQAIVLRIMPKNTLENQRRHSGFANERIRRRLSLQTDRPDFMTPFLKQNPDFKYMSQGEIESTFSMLITAGSETSATVLCGILNHLTRPEYRAALRRLERVIRDRFVSEDAITIESTKNIAYLDAVISEGLRLCNPMPGGLPRVVPPGGDMYAGHYLPGGVRPSPDPFCRFWRSLSHADSQLQTRVSVRPYVLSRSEKNFALAHEYHPERWLPASERPARFAHDNLKVSKPFSTGPSACLGKPLAWAEMRLILSRLVWAFDMSCDEGRRVDWAKLRAKMMIEKEPMWIRLKIRHNWLVVGHHPEPPCACRTAALAANKSA